MKIEISRSFSRKIQVKQYEPIEFFCAAKMEVKKEKAEETSSFLDKFVQNEVEKSALGIRQKNRSKNEMEEKHFEARDFEENLPFFLSKNSKGNLN